MRREGAKQNENHTSLSDGSPERWPMWWAHLPGKACGTTSDAMTEHRHQDVTAADFDCHKRSDVTVWPQDKILWPFGFHHCLIWIVTYSNLAFIEWFNINNNSTSSQYLLLTYMYSNVSSRHCLTCFTRIEHPLLPATLESRFHIVSFDR